MKRVDSFGATPEKQFTHGDPVAGVSPTRVPADWLNSVQEELATVVEAASITLDQSGQNTGQLLEAIRALIDEASGGIPIGSIQAFGGPISNIPAGWLLCDGRELLRADAPELFAAIGTAWGAGAEFGANGFRIPDLRGQFLRGVDGGSGTDPNAATRTASGSGGNTGSAVGTIQSDEIKSHTHSVTLRLGDNNNDESTPPAASNGVLKPAQYTVTSAATGGLETRPKNAAVHWIIKAGQIFSS